MTLPLVAKGDPHVAAHNAERAVINELSTSMGGLPADLDAIRPTFGDLFKPRLPTKAPSSKVSLTCRPYVTAIDGSGATYVGAAMLPYVKLSGNPLTNAYGISVDESGQNSSKMMDIETIFTGKDCTFMQYHLGASAIPEALRVWVDDEEVDMNPFAFTAVAQWYLDFNFAVYGTYKIRIAGGYFLNTIASNAGSSFHKPEPRKALGVIADSYFESLYGLVLADSPPAWLATLTGWDVWNGAQGGTGFVATGGGGLFSPFGSEARLAAIDAMEIDALLVNGSINDWQQSFPAVKAAMIQFYEDVAELKPGMPIVQVGLEPVTAPSVAAPPALADLVTAQMEAVEASPNVVGYIDPYTAPRWFSGTGDEGVMDNNGNQDYLISTDGIHPSARGSKHYVSLIVDRMKNMKASL